MADLSNLEEKQAAVHEELKATKEAHKVNSIELLCISFSINISLPVKYIIGPFHANVNQTICRLEIVFDRLWYPLSILLLATIGAKLICLRGGLQIGK